MASIRSLSTLTGLRAADLRHDLPAGLALSALLVPAGMAYATLAGLPPVHGLYTTVAVLVAYALIGPSRILVLGPDSALSPMIFAAITPLVVADDPGSAVALAGMLALLVGVFQVVFGLVRFGVVATLFSKPVRIGYLNGLAVVIVVGQLPTLLGYPSDASGFVGEVGDFIRDVGDANGTTVLVGLGTLAVLLLARRLPVAVPSVLVAVVAATAVVDVLDLADHGVSVVGTVPRGIPRPELPWTSIDDVGPLAVAALGIVLVSLADTIAVSTAFGARRHDHVDPDREIVAVGVANLAAGFLQGFATSASSTRTAVAEESGARSQVTGLVGAGAVAVLLVAAPWLLRDLPDAALAAVVIVAALALVDVKTLRRLWPINPSAVACSLAATLGVVFVGVLEGVLIAVGLSILLFFHRAWIARDDVLGRVRGMPGWHSIEQHPEAVTVPGILLYRFEAPLFFANAGRFRERVRELVDSAPTPYHHVVLQCEAVTDIDETAAEVLAELAAELAAQGIQLVFVELRHHPRLALAAYDTLGEGQSWTTYRSTRQAIQTITGATFDDLGLEG